MPVVNVVPKSVTGNGRAMSAVTSSPWLPMSVVPGTMALPVEVAVVYGGQTGQGGTAGGVKSWKILVWRPASIPQVGPLPPGSDHRQNRRRDSANAAAEFE